MNGKGIETENPIPLPFIPLPFEISLFPMKKGRQRSRPFTQL